VIRTRSPLRRRLVTLGYGVFYLLPPKWRTRIVRLVTPRYVLGSVVLIFDSEAEGEGQQRILLLRQPPGRGWSLPAGLLQKGETPVAGACREAAEETGIDLREEQLEPALPNAVVHTNGRWVDMVFLSRVPASSTTLAVDGAEVWEAAWHPVSDLPRLTRATAHLLSHYGIATYDGP
jgi:ADP-ribose pyrophosphatase YjhB (NUDIX family)